MDELQLRGPLAIERRTSKLLSRLTTEAGITIRTIDARADIEAAKVDAIGYVGIRAMQQAALLSQMEQSLAQTVPHASGRLATIADLTALGIADVAASASRRLGR